MKWFFCYYIVGFYDSFMLYSDYVIDDKVVVLQKWDYEGFGFVFWGVKVEIFIEEFMFMLVFLVLQYFELVDVEGVVWRVGFCMGDFFIEVNGVNVVKVGYKQVVVLICQGGNCFVMKVVFVIRKLEEDGVWCRVLLFFKRVFSIILILCFKFMIVEFEEFEKLDEMLVVVVELMLRLDIVDVDFRVVIVKQRFISWRIIFVEISLLFECQGFLGLEKLLGFLWKGILWIKFVGEDEKLVFLLEGCFLWSILM